VRQTVRDLQLKRRFGALASDGTRRLVVAATVGAVAVILGSTASYAAPPGAPTRGDAESIFQGFPGGTAILAHAHVVEGVPGVLDRAFIYPGLDNAEYCGQGWHVIRLGFFDDPAFFGGNAGLFDYLSAVDLRFVLDGVPLQTERTAIKRLAQIDPAFLEDAFGFAFGAFLPPGVLSVGTHQLETVILDPVFGDFAFTTGFTVVDC
jgi:hypothetical protein